MSEDLMPIAMGGNLEVATLLRAYQQGIFPWYGPGQPILWWSPDPRMVLKTSEFKVHRSLLKKLRKFTADTQALVRINYDFEAVIRACAQSARAGQSGTWIGPDMLKAYIALHQAGYAHSFETWQDDTLLGGLYCVAIGKAVFGESMFSRVSDASKIALSGLVALCRYYSISTIDCQQQTAHLARLGGRAIAGKDFLQYIQCAQNETGPDWQALPCVGPEHWAQLLG